MNLLSRLFVLLFLISGLAAPAVAAVSPLNVAGSCDIVAADDISSGPDGKISRSSYRRIVEKDATIA